MYELQFKAKKCYKCNNISSWFRCKERIVKQSKQQTKVLAHILILVNARATHPLCPLDFYNPTDVDFIKIDAEGYEPL